MTDNFSNICVVMQRATQNVNYLSQQKFLVARSKRDKEIQDLLEMFILLLSWVALQYVSL